LLRPEVQELRWRDPPLGEVATPKAKLRLTLSVGSGLARRPGDRPGVVWGLGDRGPNIKVAMAIKLYGLDHLSPLKNVTGAKVLPLPDAIARVQAFVMDFVPGRPFSTDNYRSLAVDNVCREPGFQRLGIQPSSMRAVVPGYLGPDTTSARYRRFRSSAGR